MLRFVLGRLAVLIPTFIGVSVIAFSFIRLLPGDPVVLLSGERVMSSGAPRRRSSHQLGYDRPLVVQYLDYLWRRRSRRFRHLDRRPRRPVLQRVLHAVSRRRSSSRSARSSSPSCSAFPAGILAAVKRGSFFDQAIMGVALIGYSMPIFWWGLLLIILFSGMLQLDAGLGPHLADVLLPAGDRLHADRLAAVGPGGRVPLGASAISSCRPSCSARSRWR